MITENEAYENLQNAIIKRAADDYRFALSGRYVDEKPPKSVCIDVTRFFRSSYFKMLTTVDGVTMLKNIKKDWSEWEKFYQSCNEKTKNCIYNMKCKNCEFSEDYRKEIGYIV